jgi:hypothetical protein
MRGCANRLDGEMRRSLYMLVAGILAFIRIFALGVAAVSLGMTDFGGASTAILRVFQLYGLLFVYLLFLQYFRPSAREALKTPCLLISAAAPVLSVLTLLAFVKGVGKSIPVDLVKTSSSIFVVILMDLLILGLVGMDSLKAKFPREGGQGKQAQSRGVPTVDAPDSPVPAHNSDTTNEVS